MVDEIADTLLENVRRTAERLLARREHSRLELQRKLQVRKYPLDVIESALDELRACDWQSDERFCEMYIRVRCEHGFGPLRIQMELQERGVNREIIERFLDESAAIWHEQIKHVYQKHSRKNSAQDFEEHARQMRFLQSRGFTAEQIKGCMKAYK